MLREYRLNGDLSQEEFAYLAQMHATAISMLERGVRQPTLHTVFVLAQAMGVSPTCLVDKSEDLSPALK